MYAYKKEIYIYMYSLLANRYCLFPIGFIFPIDYSLFILFGTNPNGTTTERFATICADL